MTAKRVSPVSESSLKVHEVPSDEVRIFPPTAINMLFPKVIPLRSFVIPEVLEVHEVPSDEVRMVPGFLTVTKMLFRPSKYSIGSIYLGKCRRNIK